MYQRFMLMDQQIKKKGMMSDQIISEVRTSNDGFIVYVVDHTPLQIKKGFLFHGDDWTEDTARELFREANDLISKKGKKFLKQFENLEFDTHKVFHQAHDVEFDIFFQETHSQNPT